MSKDPAFLFYSSDFLTGVSDLTFEERGQFITLLCLHHQKGRLTKKIMELAVPHISSDVLMKFKLDKSGLYYNTRIELEANKRSKYSKKQSDRAKEGWKKRRNSGKATADATALPLEDRNESSTVLVISNKVEEIKNSHQWLEACAKNYGLTLDGINKRIDEFLTELELKKDLFKSTDEIQNHFINVIRNEAIKRKNSNDQTQHTTRHEHEDTL